MVWTIESHLNFSFANCRIDASERAWFLIEPGRSSALTEKHGSNSKTGALHLTRNAGMARCVSAVLDSFIQAFPRGTRQYSVSMHVVRGLQHHHVSHPILDLICDRVFCLFPSRQQQRSVESFKETLRVQMRMSFLRRAHWLGFSRRTLHSLPAAQTWLGLGQDCSISHFFFALSLSLALAEFSAILLLRMRRRWPA